MNEKIVPAEIRQIDREIQKKREEIEELKRTRDILATDYPDVSDDDNCQLSGC